MQISEIYKKYIQRINMPGKTLMYKGWGPNSACTTYRILRKYEIPIFEQNICQSKYI